MEIKKLFENEYVRLITVAILILCFFYVGKAAGYQKGMYMGNVLCNDFIVENYLDDCYVTSSGNYDCSGIGNNEYNITTLNLGVDINEEEFKKRQDKYN